LTTSPWTVERLATCTSTMDEARKRARAGAPDGFVVVAEEQTAGRGQRGHTWYAPKGGLYLSFVVRGLSDIRLLTIALGNAVADALEVAGVEPRLKWVNDVLVDGRKVAGVLVEGEWTGPKLDFMVVGIGVNVNGAATAFPGGLRATAITLEESLHCESCIPDLESLLLQKVDAWLDLLRKGDNARIAAAFRQRDALQGQRVSVANGHAVEGTADGIDDLGRLRVLTAGGPRLFDQGPVRVLD
jgi:BirA family biotin operon repressor/biotin-[acetyl-CoA-carboxylase] ligase